MGEKPNFLWWWSKGCGPGTEYRGNVFVEHKCCEEITEIGPEALYHVLVTGFKFCPFCGSAVTHEDIWDSNEFMRRSGRKVT